MSSSRQFFNSLLPGMFFCLLIWSIFSLEQILHWDLSGFGLQPRLNPLAILTYPLIHGNLQHLASNSVSAFLLMALMRNFDEGRWYYLLNAIFYICSGLLLYFIGRDYSSHIGASGFIYAIAFYLVLAGLFSGDSPHLVVSLLVIVLNMGLFLGLFPNEKGISWEGHLSGAVVGSICGLLRGLYYRRNSREQTAPYADDREDERPFFIQYEEKVRNRDSEENIKN